MDHFDTLILGAGAAGMMCAAHSGGRTLVIDHARAPGEKIRISGGGRCNFTNLHVGPDNFLSSNPHFAKSALGRFGPQEFIALVEAHGIGWHEKTLGQLFCDRSAKDIVSLLLAEMEKAGAALWLHTGVDEIGHDGTRFTARLTRDGAVRTLTATNLVLATGGKSIPKMGASGLAYALARQFGLRVTETRPALVPFTFGPDVMDGFTRLAGVATPVRMGCNGAAFDEAMLFTHRGLSGPAALQTSSFWREGETVQIDLLPGRDAFEALRAQRAAAGRKALSTHLAALLPARLAGHVAGLVGATGNLADCSDSRLREIADLLHGWTLRPAGTEGYRTAEVTLGGVDTRDLDSRTLEARKVPGLYVIGEAVDVTGWLGGYNFQWAWASGWAGGTAIAARLS